MSPLFFSIDCNFEILESAFRGERQRRYQLRPWRTCQCASLFFQKCFLNGEILFLFHQHETFSGVRARRP